MNVHGVNSKLHHLWIANNNRRRKLVQPVSGMVEAAKRRANELAVARENMRAGKSETKESPVGKNLPQIAYPPWIILYRRAEYVRRWQEIKWRHYYDISLRREIEAAKQLVIAAEKNYEDLLAPFEAEYMEKLKELDSEYSEEERGNTWLMY